MKKFFKTLLIAAMGIFAFSSCEDVPAPYDVPGSGDGGSVIEQPDPAGTGTVSDPYNVAAILEVAAGLGTGETAGPYYIKGIVSSIKEVSASFGNATFYISDTGGTNNTFYVYRALGLDNKNVTSDDLIKVGDEVVICGNITNYNGTLETVQKGAYIYSINGGGGNGGSEEIATSKENPYSVADAQSASGSNYVRGYIVGYIDGMSLESGARFEVPTEAQTEILLADDPDEVDPSKVYPVQLPSGDIRNALELSAHPELLKQEVLLFGSIERYFNVPGMKSTSWARLGDKEYGKDPEAEEVPGAEPTGDGTLESPFNVAAAVKYTTALGADVESTEAVYVKGKIKTITTTQAAIDNYGNHTFTMVDVMESSETFMAFQVYAPGNVKFTSLDQIKVGDEVVVYGKVVNYKGNTPETVGKGQAYVYSINGSTEGGGEEGGGEEGGDEPEPGDVTAISIADFLSKADTQTTYQLTGTVQNIKNETYGNFDLVDATGSIYIYGLLDLEGNTKNFASLGIAAGDEVTLTGVYSEYNGSPQIKNAQFVSVKKGEGGEEGGEDEGDDTPSGDADASLVMALAFPDCSTNTNAGTFTLEGIEFCFEQNGGNNAPKYYYNANADFCAVRMYALNAMTITAPDKMAKVTIHCASPSGSTNYNGNSTMTTSAGEITQANDNVTVTIDNINSNTFTLTNQFSTNSGGVQLRVVSVDIAYVK